MPETFYMDRLVKVGGGEGGVVHNDYSNVISYNMESLMGEDGSMFKR